MQSVKQNVASHCPINMLQAYFLAIATGFSANFDSPHVFELSNVFAQA